MARAEQVGLVVAGCREVREVIMCWKECKRWFKTQMGYSVE